MARNVVRPRDPRATDRAVLEAAEARVRRNQAILEAVDSGEPSASVGGRFGINPATVDIIVARMRQGVPPSASSAGTERSVTAAAVRASFGGTGRPHPTTGNPEYTPDQEEFLRACESYRQSRGRPFLLACDYLHVLKGLGYSRGGSSWMSPAP